MFSRRWRLLVAGAVLGSVITAGILLVSPVLTSNSWIWKWADWTGIGEDTITKKSIERKGGENGSIEKVTFTDETQSGKTLWDFLELLSALAVPFLLLYLGNQLQQKEKEIAGINLREEALQSYLDRVSELLINNKANSLEPSDSLLELIKDIVRTRTLTILRSLDKDGERKGSVIRFLIDAELISNWEYIVLNLNSASLKGAKLSGTQLSRALLSQADLHDADLSDANLSNANLSNANLRNADLTSADLTSADLTSADLTSADLRDTKLTNAKLTNAKLTNANLSNADLTNADLTDTERSNVNWNHAILKDVKGLLKE
ncbi:pentapeptide repeat-containing protein [Nostoc sp. TCL240-02]|uniref:pentapeptide repeat-containing protein n=1 Tax=Nostoc sp. TCL240-02 TaxID=2572090 RepID=UPI00157FBB00|nr:pentapeptide repeat-containing protein [Nostoc sp. TCL240-02]QKQ73347.1 pentapeptide repeat-containing protein [Nostoc sp. TCL240-02]